MLDYHLFEVTYVKDGTKEAMRIAATTLLGAATVADYELPHGSILKIECLFAVQHIEES